MWVMPSSSARCAQLPRAADKVPFYAALKKFRDYLNGLVAHVDEAELVFPDNTSRRPQEEMEIRRYVPPTPPLTAALVRTPALCVCSSICDPLLSESLILARKLQSYGNVFTLNHVLFSLLLFIMIPIDANGCNIHYVEVCFCFFHTLYFSLFCFLNSIR